MPSDRFGLGTSGMIAGGLLLVTGAIAAAVPLDNETCRLLHGERVQLEQAGVRESMANGPEWAATNLPAARLIEIQRLIALDEQVTFRCPGLVATLVTDSSMIPLPKRRPADPGVPAPKRKPALGR